jgi:cytochrome c5
MPQGGSVMSRHRRTVPLVAVLAIGLLEAGCYPKTGPAPTALSADTAASASSRWPGVTASSLSAGHDLFVANCNVCHGYPDVTSISEADWPHILDSMAKKSHLDAEQRDEVLHFVLASRSEQTGR